ncbi:hypothetical protein LJC07_01185 [Christensenellaceae bacterium OttesenSCG-928-L17]|nr:hypothetical protein [Christensenellaceae bacterium OttesenSCG-928-L17]
MKRQPFADVLLYKAQQPRYNKWKREIDDWDGRAENSQSEPQAVQVRRRQSANRPIPHEWPGEESSLV